MLYVYKSDKKTLFIIPNEKNKKWNKEILSSVNEI